MTATSGSPRRVAHGTDQEEVSRGEDSAKAGGLPTENSEEPNFLTIPYYKLGDGLDNDYTDEYGNEYPWEDADVDDTGYWNDLPNDDDENGAGDDFHGYDFVGANGSSQPASPYPGEDYTTPDNNTFTQGLHGNWCASALAASATYGRMLGVAPGVKVLPIRAGTIDTGTGIKSGRVVPYLAILGVAYAREIGADIISCSFLSDSEALFMVVQAAIDEDGIIFAFGAGNRDETDPTGFDAVSPRLMVAGLNNRGEAWYGGALNDGTAHGDWIDISACVYMWVPGASYFDGNYSHYTFGYESGTSLAAPQVAGVAALVKSVYPQYSRDEILNKVLGSVDDIYSDPNWQDPEYMGKLGSGRVNAYKAVTFYDTIPEIQPDTTWAGEIWIGGDITVVAGDLLTVAAGTVIHVARDDLLSAGSDPNGIEFIIDGTMVIEGSHSSPVVFELFDDPAEAWAVIENCSVSQVTFTADNLDQLCAISRPEINTQAEYPIVAGNQDQTTVFVVGVSHPLGFTDMMVTLDATSMGGGSSIVLTDDGLGDDLVDDDGIYTSQPQGIVVNAGTCVVEVSAEAVVEYGGDSTASVEIEAIDSGLKLLDGSADTGDLATNLNGEPYASSFAGINIESQDREVLILSKDQPGGAPQVFLKGNVVNGVPDMDVKTVDWFPIGELPPPGGRGISIADYDNDGLDDMFICNLGTAPRLYHNTGTGFASATSGAFESNELGLLNQSHLAAWGDYNQDGWVDLFVATVDYSGSMSAIGDTPPTGTSLWTLFKNTGGQFVKTTGILPGFPAGPALSASWNDLDADGDLDLVVGYIDGSSDPNPRVYINQGYKKLSGDFVFYDLSSTWGVSGLDINSLDWIDYNHDEFPDLVVTCFSDALVGQGAKILANVSNAGVRKFEEAETIDTDGIWEGATIGDLDQNGEQDIVLLPHAGIPRVFMATEGSPIPTYQDLAFPLGVRPAATAFTSGGFAADLNNDHDLDLYLGRPKTDQFLYRNVRQDGLTDPPATGDQNWIDIDLSTLGNSNASLIGTRVKVTDPGTGKSWTQVVDGGSGRGCQSPNQLHFGLGSCSGPVNVTVDWPTGPETTPIAYAVNEPHLIVEDAVAEIQAGSLIFTHEPYPGGADWVFTWLTDAKGDIREDIVEFQYEPGYSGTPACTINPAVVLEWSDLPDGTGEDVEMSVYPTNGYWTHKVVWKGQFCSPNETCHFQFRATSGVAGDTTPSAWANFGYFDACFTRFPPPQQ